MRMMYVPQRSDPRRVTTVRGAANLVGSDATRDRFRLAEGLPSVRKRILLKSGLMGDGQRRGGRKGDWRNCLKIIPAANFLKSVLAVWT